MGVAIDVFIANGDVPGLIRISALDVGSFSGQRRAFRPGANWVMAEVFPGRPETAS